MVTGKSVTGENVAQIGEALDRGYDRVIRNGPCYTEVIG